MRRGLLVLAGVVVVAIVLVLWVDRCDDEPEKAGGIVPNAAGREWVEERKPDSAVDTAAISREFIKQHQDQTTRWQANFDKVPKREWLGIRTPVAVQADGMWDGGWYPWAAPKIDHITDSLRAFDDSLLQWQAVMMRQYFQYGQGL